jgi:hypothetical protein
LKLLIQFMQITVATNETASFIPSPLPSPDLSQWVSAEELALLDVSNELLLNVIDAANKLQVESLERVALAKMASRMLRFSLAEIRAQFNIIDDMSLPQPRVNGEIAQTPRLIPRLIRRIMSFLKEPLALLSSANAEYMKDVAEPRIFAALQQYAQRLKPEARKALLNWWHGQDPAERAQFVQASTRDLEDRHMSDAAKARVLDRFRESKGRRCLEMHCTERARDPTVFCDKHKCRVTGCANGVYDSETYCDNHSCNVDRCQKGGMGATGYCVGHGGGRRCMADGCTKGAQGATAFCVQHGGGRRCQHNGCRKGAVAGTAYCRAHGAGRR